jgi:hypothetical protein
MVLVAWLPGAVLPITSSDQRVWEIRSRNVFTSFVVALWPYGAFGHIAAGFVGRSFGDLIFQAT